MAPTYEVGREGKLGWLATLDTFPGKTTTDNIGGEKLASIISYQYLDRE